MLAFVVLSVFMKMRIISIYNVSLFATNVANRGTKKAQSKKTKKSINITTVRDNDYNYN